MKKLLFLALILMCTSVSKAGSPVIKWELMCNNLYWDKNNPEYAYLYVSLKGTEKTAAKERVPLNISLVLDRSGSMSGREMIYAREAAAFVINQLSSTDILSVVNYDHIVEVTSPSQYVQNKEVLIRDVQKITARGMTNLSGGLLEGYKQVQSTKKDNYVSRVLLLTDGMANEGITNPEKLQEIASKFYLEHGIALSTFGLGASYNEDLLTQMAESGRGNYYYIDEADKIPSIFAKELDGLLNVVAQNAEVIIELPDGVKFDKIYGYPSRQDKKKTYVALSDIFANEEKTFLLKIKLDNPQIENLEFNTHISFIDSENFTFSTFDKILKMQATADKELLVSNINNKVVELKNLFEATESFDEVLKDIDKNDYKAAKTKMSGAIKELQEAQKTLPSESLNKQEKKMQEYMENIDSVEKMQTNEKQSYQKSTKSMNYSTKKMKVIK